MSALRLQIDQIDVRVWGRGGSEPGFLRLEMWGASVRRCVEGSVRVVAGGRGEGRVAKAPSELS